MCDGDTAVSHPFCELSGCPDVVGCRHVKLGSKEQRREHLAWQDLEFVSDAGDVAYLKFRLTVSLDGIVGYPAQHGELGGLV